MDALSRELGDRGRADAMVRSALLWRVSSLGGGTCIS